MADCTPRRSRAAARLVVALAAAVAFVGCNRSAAPVPPPEPAAEASSAKDDAKSQVKIDPRLTQPFTEATRQDPPADWPRLADTTANGKSVGKVYTDVVRLWKEIPFVTPEGKKVEYTATLDTELGSLEIGLRPDVAPNHVRNFVALARAGYYDGLVFERIIHQVSDVEKGVTLDLIEGGGPLGAADATYDSIGYWLKPEFDAKVPHEEGTVGAAHGDEVDTASCKFYIIVNKPPESLNGNFTVFGKVTKGLDVARKIHQRPTVEDETNTGYHKPEKAVVIRKVSIQTREVDAPGTNGENK